MTPHYGPDADGVICAATLDDAAADPELTLDAARGLLRDAAAGIDALYAELVRMTQATGYVLELWKDDIP